MLYVDSTSHAVYALEYHPISALKELTHANDQGQAHNSITHRVLLPKEMQLQSISEYFIYMKKTRGDNLDTFAGKRAHVGYK
jgi:hypothetical protein